MKKLIDIKHLDVGMFLEADVVREEKDGEERASWYRSTASRLARVPSGLG